MEEITKTVKLYKGKIKISFDEKNHIFEKDGERLVSVTAITGQIDKSRALIPWAINLMKRFLITNWNPEKKIEEEEKLKIIDEASRQHIIVKEREATIGELAHDWAEQWTKGKNPKIPEEERLRNCVISFLRWIDETKIKPNPKNSEKIIYSKKYNYVGIMDDDGKEKDYWVIIDFKATNGIYNEMRYQLAGYWNAAEEESKRKYKKGYIVQFGKDTGEFKVVEISREEYGKDFKAFLGALYIKRRERELSNGRQR